MSAQLTLTDLEMLTLQKCIREAQAVAQGDGEFWDEGEAPAALSAYQKLQRGLDRPGRRAPRK